MGYGPESHHRRSVRLAGYDYRWPGAYFVTICTYKQRCVLGQVVGEEWLRTASLRPNVTLDAFVIMPNHLHGIIALDGRGTAAPCPYDAPRRFGEAQRGSLAAIIGAFKSAVTRRVNAHLGTPGIPFWQRSYYEHVIRDACEWERIATYIASNPLLWADERLQPPTAFGGAAQASGKPDLTWRPA